MALWRAQIRGLAGKLFQRALERIANVLHKRRAALLIFLIQSLRLFQLLVHQHFSVLIANDKDLGT
ncbi:hypothetical protein D3C87_1607490 [compost metagenome]